MHFAGGICLDMGLSFLGTMFGVAKGQQNEIDVGSAVHTLVNHPHWGGVVFRGPPK